MHTTTHVPAIPLLLALAACSYGGYDSDDSDFGGAYGTEPGSPTDPGDTLPESDDTGFMADGEEPPPAPGTIVHQPWVTTADDAISTFSIDVDRASYTYGRRMLQSGWLPSPETVRIEEWVNAMDWTDAGPTDDSPFAIHVEAAPSRFDDGDELHLVRIALKAMEIAPEDRDPANLVFLVDVSGSMSGGDRLGLIQETLRMLLQQLNPEDTLSIVTYASRDDVLLPPTPVSNAATIEQAIRGLTAGGSTAGADGLNTAYGLATQAFRADGINRVVLCTDGDFNVGLTGEALVQEVAARAEAGIDLTVLGVGYGNFNDGFLEQLTNDADGTYHYLDSMDAAEFFVEHELMGAMQVVARDTKIQVVFEPDTVERYRLVGYANRILEDDDFEDDSKDAGDIGAGHHVTAFYEVELTGTAGDLAEVRLRHQPPEGGASALQTRWIASNQIAPTFGSASANLRAGAAVAELAEILSASPHAAGADFDGVREAASTAWPTGSRTPRQQELIELVDLAHDLWP